MVLAVLEMGPILMLLHIRPTTQVKTAPSLVIAALLDNFHTVHDLDLRGVWCWLLRLLHILQITLEDWNLMLDLAYLFGKIRLSLRLIVHLLVTHIII